MLKSHTLATLINSVTGYASFIHFASREEDLSYIAILYLMVLVVTTAKKDCRKNGLQSVQSI